MAIAAVAGVIGGIFGAVSGASQQNSARSAEQKRINAQYKYDNQLYKYNWNNTLREYDYRIQETNIGRLNQENNLRYQEQSALRDYQYTLAIRDFDYQQQVRQYNESERIYGMQLGFNNQAAQLAHQAEQRRYEEILTGMAFDQQDMLVKMLQEEGQLQAAGVSGRSAGKVLAAAMAGYGRNQAILAESLVSATKETNVARRQIDNDKYGADLAAESRRMLSPMLAPAPMAPLKMPRATLLDPLAPTKPPKPLKGVNTMPAASGLSIANNFLTTGLSLYTGLGGTFGKK